MLKFLQRRRHTTDKGLHPKYYKLYTGLKLWHTPKMSFVLLEAYFDSPKQVHFEAKIGNFSHFTEIFSSVLSANSAKQ